jgi:hypothetical protein
MNNNVPFENAANDLIQSYLEGAPWEARMRALRHWRDGDKAGAVEWRRIAFHVEKQLGLASMRPRDR